MRFVILIIFNLTLLFSCSSSNEDESKEEFPKKTEIKSPPRTELVSLPSPPKLNTPRLVRRLILDAHHKLPDETQKIAIKSNTLTLEQWVDSLLASPLFAKAIANNFLKLWNLDQKPLTNLETFATNDATLSSLFTNDLKAKIRQEPTLTLRFIIEQNQPFSQIFLTDWSIAHTSVSNLWEGIGIEQLWENNNFTRFHYADSRPKIGILANMGFYATIDHEYRTLALPAAQAVFKNLLCNNLQSPHAHNFNLLGTKEFGTDYLTVASSKKQCAGCHKHFKDLSLNLYGFQKGDHFSEWLQYSSENPQTTNIFSGQKYDTLEILATMISKDPRFHQCTLKNLYSYTLQRNIHSNDIPFLSNIYNQYISQQFNIKEIYKRLFLSDTYSSDILNTTTDSRLKDLHSGVKLLNYIQLKSIIEQYSNVSELLTYPTELSIGELNEFDRQDVLTSHQFHEILYRFSTQAANQIIKNELTSNQLASERKLLSLLPNDFGITTDKQLITKQIYWIWETFTSLTEKEDSQTIKDFVTLWETGYNEGANNIDSTQKAWILLLSAILMSPEFILY